MLKNTIYILLTLLSLILGAIPRKLALYIGKFLGFLMYYFFPLRKKVAYKNLTIVFPSYSDKKINKKISINLHLTLGLK